ncbi:15268_t:CDS:10 [Funneliformis geosporum]|uniref:132_t:CDS:1 n=1 Tax=Funneliformis geosporum TaxID=1117311 RepID=A0A9W4SET5_9GLOM|nr:132_t:CDS:10 [Funneliformis geosporum]CAI2167647.1 15268_t:CDS:10 [Funneliformis geosporum]
MNWLLESGSFCIFLLLIIVALLSIIVLGGFDGIFSTINLLYNFLFRPTFSPERNVPEKKEVCSSRITMTEIVLPSHADIRGFVFGGVILEWIDLAAGYSAKKHAVYPCVTRSVDAVHFMHPIKVGDFLTIQASVNRAWNTSMEVGVRVETENPITGKRKYCCHAYLTFVALSGSSKSVGKLLGARHRNLTAKVPRIIPVTPIEQQRYDYAEIRRQARVTKSKHTDDKGHREQHKLEALRELLREWSEHYNTETKSTAELPPLLQEPEAYSAESNDPAKVYLIRRSSTLKGLPIQPDTKFSSESFAEVVETVLPQHANTLQITFGGQIMKWMEHCCLVSASRHSRRFLLLARPTYVGDCITVRSIVSCTFHSSLEVYVSVEAENLMTGERFFTNDGFYTMVAVDSQNVPTPVPQAITDYEQEYEVFKDAEVRRTRRLQQRRELIQKEMAAHPKEFEKYTRDNENENEN